MNREAIWADSDSANHWGYDRQSWVGFSILSSWNYDLHLVWILDFLGAQ